ncbi:MAG: hypothetical protein PHR87_01280 [Sulfurospirillaceae bacterium]|nr:hypothetical protein [Sulfurospirillaceae bacterium]
MKNFIPYRSFFVSCATVALLMQGCALTSPQKTPTINTKNVSKETQSVASTNPKLSNLVGRNYIKGIVTSVKRDDGLNTWNYIIEGIDTSNGKLPYVNFNHKSVQANESDLVYATFDGNHLTEMLVIKPGFMKAKRPPVMPKKKNSGEKSAGKRDKEHQILAIPQEETIRLN